MSILFGTGEDEIITLLGATITTDSAHFRPAYARCAISAGPGPWQHLFAGKLRDYLDGRPSNDVDVWWGSRFKGGGGFLSSQPILYFFDDADKVFARLLSGSPGSARLQTSSDGVAFTDFPGSDLVQPSAPAEWTFRVKKHPTLGRIEWWANGGLWFKTPNFDTTALISGKPKKMIGYHANSNGNSYWSEIMATSGDDPRVGLNLHTLPPIADGDFSGWDGDWTRIAEIVKNTSTVISTAVDDSESSFVNAGVGTLTTGTVIRAIIHSGEYRTSNAPAPDSVTPGLVLGGVAYPGATYPVDNTPTQIQEIWETSPDGGLPFTEAEGNDVQMHVRSVVTP